MMKKKDRVIRRNKKPRRKKAPIKSIWQWFFIICAIIFCGALLYIFFLSPLVNISNIEVRGTQRLHKNDILNIVDENIAGERFWYIKNKSYFFINKKIIGENIKNDQRIKSVHISKKFPNQLFVNVTEYDIVPIWCIGDTRDMCFELNEAGCVVRNVDTSSALVQNNKHFIVADHGHGEIHVGQCVVSSENLDKIQFFGEELVYAFNVGIKKPYTIDFRGSGEVKFDTDEGWYALVDLDHEKKEVLHVASLFAKKVELPSRRTDLEYVDLRFPEKMFYKMRDGVEQEELNQDVEERDDEKESSDSEKKE